MYSDQKTTLQGRKMNCHRPFWALLFCFLVLYLFPHPVYAYLDPGTGNVLVFVLISLVGTIFYLIKGFGYRALTVLRITHAKAPIRHWDADIVLFSEGKSYWYTFKPIVEAFIARGRRFSYVSMDIEDPALMIEHDLMSSRYVGSGSAGFARIAALRANVMISTTPNIGTPEFPLPRPSRVNRLGHVFHSVSDVATYHKGSLDHYDAVLMVGDFLLPSIRRLEKLRNLPPKECVSLGLPYLDELAKHVKIKTEQSAQPVVLVAPSWGTKSCFSVCGTDFLVQLAEAGYDVIVRPHPHSFRVEQELLNAIKQRLANYPNVRIDSCMDATESMRQADVLISDTSSFRFDFAFLYEKPVITMDIPINNPQDYELGDLGVAWEDTVAHRLGPVVRPESLTDIIPVIHTALSFKAVSLVDFRKECLPYFGRSGEAIADWAIRNTNKAN